MTKKTMPSSSANNTPPATRPATSSSGHEFVSSSSPTSTTTTCTITATPTPFCLTSDQPYLLQLPVELQVHWLTFLRAYDLAAMHQTCHYYHNPVLVHAIVTHTSNQVYPAFLTTGFEQQPVFCDVASNAAVTATATTGGNKKKTPPPSNTPGNNKKQDAIISSDQPEEPRQQLYTFEHLRNMELIVIARVLSQPEPATGYVVSKSWCKTALSWLAARQERQYEQLASHNNNNKKKKVLSKKKQRLRQRRLSDACPPWPNVNSDLLCPHNALQHCTSSKTARARRKVLDKQAWKILKKLFPDSTPLEAECVQCAAEQQIARLNEQKLHLERKLERKQPLANPLLRRFYTRTKGVPEQALLVESNINTMACDSVDDATLTMKATTDRDNQEEDGDDDKDNQDRKLPARPTTAATRDRSSSLHCNCPLKPGTYFILPRKWCYGWRRYMRTGEGGIPTSTPSSNSSSGNSTTTAATMKTSYPAPDAASLLCDAHRMLLLPPHLEAYLYGKQAQLLSSSSETAVLASPTAATMDVANSNPPPAPARRVIPGQAPEADPESMEALLAAGLSPDEVRQQLSVMQSMQQEQDAQQQYLYSPSASLRHSNLTNNERLDRENHSVVEIVTQEEFQALERLWDKQPIFGVSFDVISCGQGESFVQHHIPVCRACDATGLAVNCRLSSRSRSLSESSHHHHHHHHSSSSAASNSAGNAKMTVRPPLEY